jgi:hypothetical protein
MERAGVRFAPPTSAVRKNTFATTAKFAELACFERGAAKSMKKILCSKPLFAAIAAKFMN